MRQQDHLGDNKHPFHLFIEMFDRNPKSNLENVVFLKNSWQLCPMFNEAFHHIFTGSDILFKTLAKFQNTSQFWEKQYHLYWSRINNERKKPLTELEKILNKFMKELDEYNKRKRDGLICEQ